MFRKSIAKSAVLHRVSVFLHGTEGVFSGILTKTDPEMYVFEQCQSVPTKEGESPVPYKGRVLIERAKVLYLVDET